MFQRVLVPLDGSACAERALPVAIRIAQAAGEQGALVLVRVVNPLNEYWTTTTLMAEPSMPQAIIDDELREASRYLESVVATNNIKDITVEMVTLFGPVAPSILSTVSSHKVDMIVMGSHGYSGVRRWVMGSVAEKIARHAAVPVLVLRDEGLQIGTKEQRATKTIRALVPLDGSAYAKTALEPAAFLTAALADPGQGNLHLLRVVPAIDKRRDVDGEQHAINKASSYLDKTIEHIRDGYVAPAIKPLKLSMGASVVADADIAGAIVRAAERGTENDGGVTGHYDFIAIATHGRGGVQRWAMGSITERVLAATRLPVLVVRPPELAHASEVVWQKVTTLV